jgi:hypothetical protein
MEPAESVTMTPFDITRIEKAAADCGFELTPIVDARGLVLRSAQFPEWVAVKFGPAGEFLLSAERRDFLDAPNGQSEIAVHGYATLYSSLQKAAAHARIWPNRVAERYRAKTAGLPRGTEIERLVVQRIGQNIFRESLIDYWQGRCCATGLAVSELLRASHIKPWASCESDEERLDVFNGLLLAPHVDALFDGGWMTFSDAGEAIFSSQLTAEALMALGIGPAMRIDGLRGEHRRYLAYHGDHVWRDRPRQP